MLEKDKIGEFIGHGDGGESEMIRRAYVSTFNVVGRSLVSSLRMFLGHFRLPGEAQQIDRILQTCVQNEKLKFRKMCTILVVIIVKIIFIHSFLV